MSTALKKLTREALELTEKDRAKLVHALIRSIDGKPDADAEAEWDAEIGKRVGEIRTGKVKGIPADSVFAKLKDKYR
jgi:putative addiction module component (TIGR02574 family)